MGEASRADMDGSDSGATLWAAIVKVAESLSLGQYFENDQQDYSNIPVHISRFIGALLSSFEVILELVPDRIDSLLSDLRTVFLTSKTTSQHDDRIVQLLKEYKDLFPYSYMFSRRSGKYPKPSFDAVNRYLRTSNSLNSHSMGSEEDDTFKDEGDDDTLGDSFPAEAFPSVLAPSLMPLKPFAHSPYDQEKASNPTRDYADAVQLSPTQQLLQHPKHQQLGRLNTLSTKEDGEDDMAFVPDEASILDSYYNNFNRPQVEEDEEDSDEDHPYFVHRKPIRRVTRMKNQQSRNASSQRTKKLTRRRPSDDSTNGPDNNTAEGDDEVSNGGMPVSSLLRLSTKTVTFASKPDYQEAQPQSPSDDNSRLGSDIEVVPLEEMSSDSVHAFDLLDNEQNDNEESASKYHDTSTTTGSTNNIQRKGSVRTSPANTEPTSILRKSSTSNNNSSNSNPAFLSPITASRSTRDESPTPSPPRHDDSSLELSDGEGGHHKHQQHKGHLSRQKDRYDVNEDTDLNSIHDNMRGYGETNKPKSTSSDPWVTAGSSYNSSSKNSDQSTSSSRSTVDRQAPLGRYKNPLDASLEEEAWYRQQQQKLSPEQRDYPSDPHANRRARYSAQDDNETHENNEEDGDREQHGRSNRRDRSQDRVRGGTWLLPERKKFAYEENYEEYLQHKEYEHDGKGNDGKSWPPHSAHSPISHGNDNRNSSPPRAKTSDKNAGKDAKKTLKENLLKFKQRKELERQQRTHQHHVQRSSKYFEPTFLTKSRQTEHAGQQQVAETDLGSKEEAHEDEEEEVIVDVVKEGPALLESGAIRRSLEGWQNKYTRPTALLQAWEAQFTSTSSNINGNNTTANQLNSPSSVSPGHEQVGNVNSSLDYLPPPRRTSSVRLPSQSDYRQQQQQSYVQQSLPSPNYARDSAEVLLRSADSQNQQPGLLYQSTTSSIGVFDRPFQELPPNVIIPPLSEYATLTGVILEGALLKKSTKNFINRWQNVSPPLSPNGHWYVDVCSCGRLSRIALRNNAIR